MSQVTTIPFYKGGKKCPAPNHAFICQKLEGANEHAEQHWQETMEQIRKEEADKGYVDESSDEDE